MEKIKMVATFFVVAIIILTTFSTIVYSENEKDVVTVEIYNIKAFSVKKKELKISVEKVNGLKDALTELSDSIDKRDVKDIENIEKKIASLGMILKGLFPSSISENGNISNRLCYFQAIGKGEVILPIIFMIIEKINERLKNVSSFVEALAVIIAMIVLYMPLILIAYLIPFKILAPLMEVKMKSGRMKTIGTEGFKSINVENLLSVEVKGFTGIVIHIPSQDNESFFFVSGFAASVNEGST